MKLTKSQLNQLKRLKLYYPYKIIFGIIDKEGDFQGYAKCTKHPLTGCYATRKILYLY